MPATDVQSQSRNGHGDVAGDRDKPLRARTEKKAKDTLTVQIRTETKPTFIEAADMAGLSLLDAMDLATDLLFEHAQDVIVETAKQRRAKIVDAAKAARAALKALNEGGDR